MVPSRSPRPAALLAGFVTAAILATAAIAAPGDITVARIDLVAGPDSSAPRDLENVGGTIFFKALDGTHGDELWKSDGASASMVDDIFDGPTGSDPSELTNVNGTLFFRARDALNDEELWKLEPPYTTPTKIEINTNPGVGSSPQDLVNFNGTLFFAANDGTAGTEVWRSNGGTVASGGTALVADINPAANEGSFPQQFTPVGATLFFTARDPDDGLDSEELWKTDGTVGNKTKLEINPAADEGSEPFDLTNTGGVLFLAAENGTVGRELFKAAQSDIAATAINIAPGAADSNPEEFAPLGGTVFFNADDGSGAGAELWESDGGTVGSGTAMVDDINPSGDSSPSRLIAFSGAVYFDADDGSGAGTELWKSNGGTVASGGTAMVADIEPGSGSSNPTGGTLSDGRLWFVAATGAAGRELWNTDGTDVHTADVAPGPTASNPNALTAGNGALLFAADDGGSVNRELWKATAEPAPPPSTVGGGGAAAPVPSALPHKKKCKKAKKHATSAKKKCKKKRK